MLELVKEREEYLEDLIVWFLGETLGCHMALEDQEI